MGECRRAVLTADGETPQTAPGGGCRGAAVPLGCGVARPSRARSPAAAPPCLSAVCRSLDVGRALSSLRLGSRPAPRARPPPWTPRGFAASGLDPSQAQQRWSRPPLTGDPAMLRAVSCQWPESCFPLSRRGEEELRVQGQILKGLWVMIMTNRKSLKGNDAIKIILKRLFLATV